MIAAHFASRNTLHISLNPLAQPSRIYHTKTPVGIDVYAQRKHGSQIPVDHDLWRDIITKFKEDVALGKFTLKLFMFC